MFLVYSKAHVSLYLLLVFDDLALGIGIRNKHTRHSAAHSNQPNDIEMSFVLLSRVHY